MSEQGFIRLEGVAKSWGSSVGVEHIDLEIGRGEFTVLLGPSGCGKSTTLRLIAGLELPNSGRLTIGGRDVTHLPPSRRERRAPSFRLLFRGARTPSEAEIARNFISSVIAAQISVGIMFAIFVVIALRARRTDSGLHKRMMILATVVPLPAAIDRIEWLPTTYPDSFVSPFLYVFLWIAPMLAWDLVRNRSLHRAYLIWASIYVPVGLLVIYLWWTPGWMNFAQRMMGVA